MFAILRHYGIPEKIVTAITKLYDQSRGTVRINGKLSDPFDISTGVLQEDVLAPFLFVIVVDYVLSRSENEHGFVYKLGSGTRSRPISALKINDLDFAEDLALLENSITVGSQQLTIY